MTFLRRTQETIIALSLLMLTACAMGDKAPQPPSCPEAGLVQGADTIAITSPAGASSEPSIIAKAEFGKFLGGCKTVRKGGTDFVMDIDIMSYRAESAMELKKQSYPYFIAVLGPDESIIQREAFVTTIPFDAAGLGKTTDKHKVHMDADAATAATYRIAIGFILTPEQLDHNRAAAASLKPKMKDAKK
jgi:hypothetical protein